MNGEHTAFVAHATHPSLGEEASNGQLVCDRYQLKFESDRGTVEIPLKRLQIQLGDTEENLIYFSDPEQPDWSIYTFDSRILQHRALLQQSQTRHQIKELQSQGELKQRLKVTLWFVLGFVVIAIIASGLMSVMVRAIVARIPAKVEQDMGAEAIAEVQQMFSFSSNSTLKIRLDGAMEPLMAALPPGQTNYKFYLMEVPIPNAFALPGGHVVVTTGLMDMADTPEELAGVIAHEIAHMTQRHIFRKQISDLGPLLLFRTFMRGGGALGTLGNVSHLLVSQSFSQSYELEADSVGWDSLVKAHINPRGMIDMFKKFKIMQDRMGHFGDSMAAFSSHPTTTKRIQRLEGKWKKLSEKEKGEFVELDRAAWH